MMRLTGYVGSPQALVAHYVQDSAGSVVATFGEPEPSVNLAREPGVVITQGSGGGYTVAGVASNPATLNNGETRASGWHRTHRLRQKNFTVSPPVQATCLAQNYCLRGRSDTCLAQYVHRDCSRPKR
ncbi:MAG: hypothetical protein Q8Q80_03865 [Methyloversatilis sp.]|nr:hypothetical protein [Methyloversatilis sp.]